VISNFCKAFGEGWNAESSQDYQDALAPDGRVQVDVYDKMLENAKKCKQARQDRENTCWNGGDDKHKGVITEVARGIDNLSDHKYKMISARRVFYCSKDTYVGRLRTFNSKADLNFPDIDQKLSIMEKDVNDGKKVNCSDIEKYSNDCERCVDASKDLLGDGFSNSTDKFPKDYNDIYIKAQDLFKRAKDLLDAAKSKSLCE
jgi:hypothetical protein